MKKLLALLLALMMVLSLAACGGGDDTPSGNEDNPGVSQSDNQGGNNDPNAPISSVKNAVGRGSYTKHNAEDAQELLVSMGLPEYPGGEIIYANEFEEGDGTVYIKDTTLDECVSYCQSLSGVSPAYADSDSNGEYVNYACEGNGFAFTIKFFAEEQENSYTMNGSPVTDVWQAEIDFAPTGGSGDSFNNEFEEFSIEAAEHFLEHYGIALSDLEPEWDWVLAHEGHAYGDNRHASVKFTRAEGELQDGEFDAYVAAVFEATAAASDDGYNIIGYDFARDGEDPLAKIELENANGMWSYRKNGVIMMVYVSVEYDRDKESELGKPMYYNGVSFDIGVGSQG